MTYEIEIELNKGKDLEVWGVGVERHSREKVITWSSEMKVGNTRFMGDRKASGSG